MFFLINVLLRENGKKYWNKILSIRKKLPLSKKAVLLPNSLF